MGARTKLNSANVLGSLIIATVLGTFTGSWMVFLVAMAALVACGLNDGSIRPIRRGR